MVLERSEYPEGFIKSFRLAYAPESKELVVEYELPWISTIPNVAEYKYNKSKDVIVEKARKSSEIKASYQDIVAAIAIRTIHEILEADQAIIFKLSLSMVLLELLILQLERRLTRA